MSLATALDVDIQGVTANTAGAVPMAVDEAPAPAATAPNVSEDEAALYDRQIRLWGLEAQNRMRRAHILVVGLTGVSTEAIKNLVLAGIGTLSLLDADVVRGEDLSAGFFWREEEIGSARVTAALPRIQALNPLVKVQPFAGEESVLLDEAAEARGLVEQGVDVVIVTATAGRFATRETLMKLNDICRRQGVRFYISNAQGFDGFIFSDAGPRHEYIVERPAPAPSSAPVALIKPEVSNGVAQNGTGASAAVAVAEAKIDPPPQAAPEKVQTKRIQSFITLREALRVSWTHSKGKHRLSPGMFATWAAWELSAQAEAQGQGEFVVKAEEVKELVEKMLKEKGVDEKFVFDKQGIDKSAFFRQFATAHSAASQGEISPTCAIIGGVLAQDVLNALGGREEPLCNWFHLEGLAGRGPVHAIGTEAWSVVA